MKKTLLVLLCSMVLSFCFVNPVNAENKNNTELNDFKNIITSVYETNNYEVYSGEEVVTDVFKKENMKYYDCEDFQSIMDYFIDHNIYILGHKTREEITTRAATSVVEKIAIYATFYYPNGTRAGFLNANICMTATYDTNTGKVISLYTPTLQIHAHPGFSGFRYTINHTKNIVGNGYDARYSILSIDSVSVGGVTMNGNFVSDTPLKRHDINKVYVFTPCEI